ncbi:MAG: glucosaminidase domain-containing protein, partial [Acidimicrobiales bacterium]
TQPAAAPPAASPPAARRPAHAPPAQVTTPPLPSPEAGRATQVSAADASVASPSVLGPPTLTAAELSGWFTGAGHRANTTVPIEVLAADYLKASGRTGVRGDVAFAQSVVETGYFSFPAYGQVTEADNNFAGIGACDSCAHGWRFSSAMAGVSAQLQLLDAYASPVLVPTPLVGPVGVGGCCTTWISLSGTWATNPNYGYEILSVYKQILDWTLPRRLAAAGLGPPVPARVHAPAPAGHQH